MGDMETKITTEAQLHERIAAVIGQLYQVGGDLEYGTRLREATTSALGAARSDSIAKTEEAASLVDLLKKMEAVSIETDEAELYLLDWRKRNKDTQALVREVHEAERVAADFAHKAITTAIRNKVWILEATEKVVGRILGAYATLRETRREDERKRLEAAAKALADEKKIEEAIEADDPTILDEPILFVMPAPPPKTVPKGVSYTDVWEPAVTSVKDLARAVADGKIPPAVLKADLVELRRWGTATKGTIQVQGLTFTMVKRPRDARR